MAKRLHDGGWYYLDLAPEPDSHDAILRVRLWHPGFWLYAVRVAWHVWRHPDGG